MRVLFVTNGLDYGGAERIVEALSRDLVAHGHEVLVVATTRGGPIADALEANGVKTRVLGIRSAFDARVAARLAQIAREFAPDVIHSHLAVSDIAVALAAPVVRRAARVTTVHNPGVELAAPKRLLWHRALRRFDRIICVSDSVKDRLPPGLSSIVIHPSLVDLDHALPSREEVRARIGIAPEERLVMAVGRLTPIKGFDVLARAAERVRTNRTRFVLIGDGPERGRLEDSRLELLGGRADADELLIAADVVACPSRSEGFPQIPLQALAVERPVVATPVGGMSEIVQHERTGLLVPVDAPEALARSLERLLEHPEERQILGRAGPEHLRSSGLLRSVMTERTRRVYAQVL